MDIIKGMGIFLMVAGHCGAPFTHFIYLFHMAIFFIASGYCYSKKKAISNSSFIAFVKRKFRTLWFPFVLWMMIFSLAHNFFIRINIYTDNPQILDYVQGKFIATTPYWTSYDVIRNILKSFIFHGGAQVGGAMWFLGTLMQIAICYCFVDTMIRKFVPEEKKVILYQGIIALLLLLAGFSCYLFGKSLGGLDKALSFYSLFYLGYVCKMYHFSDAQRSAKTHILILTGCFMILLIMNELGSIELGANQYVNPLYLLVASGAGWQFLYEIAEIFKRIYTLKDAFVTLGQNTLAILILHFLSFKIVACIGVLITGKPLFLIAAFPVLPLGSGWWLAYLAVGLMIPLQLNLWRKRINNLA